MDVPNKDDGVGHKKEIISIASSSALLSSCSSTLPSLEAEYLYLITKHLKGLEQYSDIGNQLEELLARISLLSMHLNIVKMISLS